VVITVCRERRFFNMNKIRVLLADNSEIFVEGLRNLLRHESAIEIVCTCVAGLEIIENAVKYKPNLVLISIDLLRHDDIELIQSINKELPRTRIIILTRVELEDELCSAVAAGVTGYATKEISFVNLIKLITLAMEDDIAIFTTLAGRLIKTTSVIEKTQTEKSTISIILSKRESQVLTLVARGFRNADVASSLFISENTVKVHMRNIMEKLNANNRQQATTRAIALGLLTRLT
jgi:two-component system, NarL family, nitrate/nitrite response regulator NarL